MIIGLTGSIGMGKSTVAAMFAAEGVPVFDADATVREMQSQGGELVPAIEAAFPGSVKQGSIDRKRLAAQVFGNPAALARLEAMVHPAVAKARQAFLLEHDRAPILLFDIPLLFEKGGNGLVDKIIVVSAPSDIQRERVLARPDMTAEKFAQILSLQTPDTEKRAMADHVIETGTTLAETRRMVTALVAKLRGS